MATTREMTVMMPQNSPPAAIRALNITWTDLMTLPVATIPMMKRPMMQGIRVSFLNAIVTMTASTTRT